MATFLKTNAERKAQKAITQGSYCKGLNLKAIKEVVERALGHIGDNGMFAEYTMHDISHVEGVLNLFDKLIPQETLSVMTYADWLMIVLAVYFHDMGMFIPSKEYDERNKNDDFQHYKEEKLSAEDINQYVQSLEEEKRDKFLYQEYVRKNHGERIYEWIINCGTKTEEPYTLINDVLNPLDEHFRKALAEICKSHQLDELPTSLLCVDKAFGPHQQEKVNLLYTAVLLRSADLLHITCDRTPNIEYRLISPRNEISIMEWMKQQAVRSLDIKRERKIDGSIDDEKQPHTLEIQAEFSKAECYFAFTRYIQYAINELEKCHSWCEESSKKNQNKYLFPWDGIDISRVVATGFCKEKLCFDIDKDNILTLLTGHTLYNDSTVVLRELIQNAIDAGKAFFVSQKEGSDYVCHIDVVWNSKSRELSVSDNGIGMNESDIKNYLLQVGASKYQSESFQKEHPNFHSISRFGIGLLTCFMISDDIDVYTMTSHDTQCRHLMIRKLNGDYLMRNDEDTSHIYGEHHGTRITLRVRPDVDMTNLVSQIKQWIILPQGVVCLHIDNQEPIIIGYKNTEDVVRAACSSLENIKLDDENYRIYTVQEPIIGLTMSCLQCKNPYTGIWSIWYRQERDRSKLLGSGVCIDGIRVTHDVPGADGNESIIVVNCAGNHAPKTNVARNDIEAGDALNKLYQVIYSKCLQMYIEQSPDLQERNSAIWVFREINYYVDHFCLRIRHANLYDKKILQDALRDIRCCVLDDGKEMSIKSLNEFPDTLYTIDSMTYTAAVNLLQDIKSTTKTPICLLAEYAGEQFDELLVLSEKSLSWNLLRMFYATYEPELLTVNQVLRSIKIRWKKGLEKWHLVEPEQLPYRYQLHANITLLITRGVEDEQMLDGAGAYKIICSNNRIFLFSGTPIHNYLIEKILIEGTDQRKVEMLLAVIAEYIWNKSIDSDEINRCFDKDEVDIGLNCNIEVRKVDFLKALNDSVEYILNFKYYYHNM